MKIVVDTNVLASGVFWQGPSAEVIIAAMVGKVQLVASPSIVIEYERTVSVMSRKRKFNGLFQDVPSMLDWVNLYVEIIEPLKLPSQVCRDPDDDKFIACAISSHASHIVTGDNDLLVLASRLHVQIIKPAEFVKKYIKT